MIGIRKSLDFVFTRRELKILDDVMPEMSKGDEDEWTLNENGVGHAYFFHRRSWRTVGQDGFPVVVSFLK